MKGKLVLIVLGLMILFSSTAGAVGRPAINFGTYIAPEEVSKTVAILVPLVDGGVEYLEVWLEGNLATEDRRLALEGQRLKLETPGGLYRVGLDPVTIPAETQMLSDDNTAALPVLITYTVSPNDLPGTYQGTLVVREVGEGEILRENRIPLRLAVDSWYKIETRLDRITIGGFSPEEGSLFSIPGILRVASNHRWELFVDGILERELNQGKLELLLNVPEDSFFVALNSKPVFLEKQEVLLGGGSPTVIGGGGFWTEIHFMLKVNDYTKIPAGVISFPMTFSIKPALEQF